jgi:hypothetical protein
LADIEIDELDADLASRGHDGYCSRKRAFSNAALLSDNG